MGHKEESLAAILLALPDERARQDLLDERIHELTPATSAELEDRANNLRLQDPVQALLAADVLLQVADAMADERARANGLRVKGNLMIYQGRYQESVACYSEAHEIRVPYGEELEIVRLQVGWTAALNYLSRYDEALKLGLATRKILIRLEKWNGLANLELNIGDIYQQTDRYDQSLAMCEHSREHFLQAGNPVGAAQAWVNASWIHVCQDRFREALTLLHQVHAVFETHEAWLPYARTDMNLALLFSRVGRYREAWEHYNQARETFRRLDNEMEVASVDLYCSRLYLDLNLFWEALDLAQGARPIFEQLDMTRYVALADFSMAAAYRGLGEQEQALESFQKARDYFAAHQGSTTVASIDLERAALLCEAGRPDDALSVAEKALAVFSRQSLAVKQAQAQLLMAECHSDLDQMGQASPLYQAVMDVPAEQRLPTLIYRAQYGLGRIAEARGQQESAYQHYQAAVEEIETIRRSLRVDEFKASFLDDKLDLYQAAVRLSLEMDHLERAFDYVERAKSSALLDLLARNLELDAEGGADVDPRAWERLRTLKEEWLWHHAELQGPPIEPQDPPEQETSNGRSSDHERNGRTQKPWGELKRVETEIRQTMRQLQGHQLHSLLGFVGSEDRSWQQIRPYLAQDTLLIEYFCIGDQIVAFLVSADGLSVCHEFPYSLREVKRSLGALDLALKGVGDLDPEYVSEVLGPLARRHLTWLYRALIAPLSASIGEHSKLIIAPHDALYYLPFHAFYDGEGYLIERFEVQYAPSASVLACCYQTQAAKRTGDEETRPALVMGYSDGGRLRHVADEVQTVAATLPRSLLFQEEEATLEQLRQQAGHCRLLHLASHAVFHPDNPFFSSIHLADEPLNVVDIYHLRLNSTLVTLSACETGVSQLQGGDLFGLARGCLYAGAPSLVASLWQVDDASTTQLMEEFYRRLGDGASIASALRAAQLALLRVEQEHTHPYAHPHYWAPFFLMGADGVL